MHSLRLPGVPPLPPSFKKHRFQSDPSRFSLNLTLSKPIPTPCWALLPSPPMSGSPPPEHPLEPPQTAGRRRKRSDTPVTHTTSPTSTPVVTTAALLSGSRAERHRDVVPTTRVNIQPATWAVPFPVAQVYGFSPPASTIPGPIVASFQSQYVTAPSPPKAIRKSKVHVPSACVNCKKKHLRCDNSRPCHRCIQSGKEDSCVDVQHKKRGRPPLKPDDSASQRYPEPGTSSTDTGGPRESMAGGPIPTDPLLYPYPYQQQQPMGRQAGMQRPPMPLAPSPFGMYAPPSVSASYATAAGTTYRPPSSSSSMPSSQPPSPYYQTPSAGTSPEGLIPIGRGYGDSYEGQAPRQAFYRPATGPYNVSLFPRSPSQQQQQQQQQQQTPFEAPASVYAPQQSIAPELQLPPIRPAPPGTYPNPAIAQQQQRQAQQQQEREVRGLGRSSDNSTRQPDAKRPRMSLGNIVNPRND